MYRHIILDIDNTLLYTTELDYQTSDPFDGKVDPNNVFEIKYPGDTNPKRFYYGVFRNGLDKFFTLLKRLNMQIYIFSAGGSEYVEIIAKILKKKYDICIFDVLSRKDCITIDIIVDSQNDTKLMQVYKFKEEYDRSDTLLVDDRPEAGDLYQDTYHYHISPFTPKSYSRYKNDDCLQKVIEHIESRLK